MRDGRSGEDPPCKMVEPERERNSAAIGEDIPERKDTAKQQGTHKRQPKFVQPGRMNEPK